MQKMFSMEGEELEGDYYNEFVVDLLNLYSFVQVDSKSVKFQKIPSTNSLI